jgi:pimeloyl-ACP methyl ester carboxylesterase
MLADVRLRALQPYHRLRDWIDWPLWRPVLQRAGIELNDRQPEGGYELLTAMARAQSHEMNTLPMPLFQTPAGSVRRNGAAQRWLQLQDTTSIRRDLRVADGLTPAVLRAIRPPVLGLYGERSPVMPTARALHRLCPHYELHRVRHAGHFFPLTRPRRLVNAALRFLATHSGVAAHFEHLFESVDHEHHEHEPEHEHEPASLLAAF